MNLSPPWLGAHPAYTAAKYGMTLITLGIGAEHAADGLAANCLWLQSLIATAAVRNIVGGEDALVRARSPQIVADAAIEILARPPSLCTGNTFLDVDVLREAGVTDLSRYGAVDTFEYDLFVDPN